MRPYGHTSMITVRDAELLERESELGVLGELLAGAREGRGGIALIEGPPGSGKTALLRAARSEAHGLRVLSAVGAELERDFAFGIVRQLFAPAAQDPELTIWRRAQRSTRPSADADPDTASTRCSRLAPSSRRSIRWRSSSTTCSGPTRAA